MKATSQRTIKEIYNDVECGRHPSGIPAETIEGVETLVGINHDSDEDDSFGIGKLKDGRFIALEESEDYTGHGCQCSGSASIYDTLEDALRLGLSSGNREEAKQILGIK